MTSESAFLSPVFATSTGRAVMSPPLPSHAILPATGASACLPCPRDRHLLVRGWSVAAATPLVAASSSSGLACCHHYSVATAPSLRASSSASPRRAGGAGLDVLTVTASAFAVSAFLIFFSAIRFMLACKRDAEFLEKYFDSAREKLPETMASVRLVGREIGDLAADLSDLSQELTKGVKSTMSIVHKAEAQLRQSPPSALPGEIQFDANNLRDSPSNYNLILPGPARRMSNQRNVAEEPLLASTVRDLRQLIADIRSGFGAAAGIAGLSMWALKFGSKGRKNRS